VNSIYVQPLEYTMKRPFYKYKTLKKLLGETIADFIDEVKVEI